MTTYHDCASEDAPGLEPGPVNTAIVHGDLVVFEVWYCRVCDRVWRLYEGMFFDPEETSLSQIVGMSRS